MAPKSFGRAHVSRTIRLNSVRRGLLGGSKFWLAVFGARFVATRIQRVTKRGDKPIRFSEPLAVGEKLVISHVDAHHERA